MRVAFRIFCGWAVSLNLSSCGPNSNPLALTTPPSHRKTYEIALAQAQARYDAGDIAEALHWARTALLLNPTSEKASITFALASLAATGLEPFQLIKTLSNGSESDEPSKQQSSSPETGNPSSSKMDREEKDGAGGVLSRLADVIFLNQDEIGRIGDYDTTVPDLPILIPKCAEEARGLVDSLLHANNAIVAVCPFIGSGAKVVGDGRHQCEAAQTSKTPGRALFVWALGHLTEAIVFNAVLNVSSNAKDKSNLDLRVEALAKQSVESLTSLDEFIRRFESLEATLSRLLPLGACTEAYPTTQLNATLNDLLAAVAAFQNMSGLPEDMVSSLTDAIKKVTEAAGPNTGIGARLQALRADFTKKMTRNLSQKIDAISQKIVVPEEQRNALCSTLSSISGDEGLQPIGGDGEEASSEKPQICKR